MRLLSIPKIGTTEEKGRASKKTVNRPACLSSLCPNCSSSCARVFENKGNMSENPSLGRNRHSLWVFYQVTIIDACQCIRVNIHKHDILKADSFAHYTPNSHNDIRSTNLICYCNWVLLQVCFVWFSPYSYLPTL